MAESSDLGNTLGNFIRERRKQAELSLRELAELAKVSNPYLSQLERGLHTPSIKVIKAIASALEVSAETLLVQAGVLEESASDGQVHRTTEESIRTDPKLTQDQRSALLAVYRSYVAQNRT